MTPQPQSHGSQCEWHYDQYPNECDCGVLGPRTRAYIQKEISASERHLERAIEQHLRWQQILLEFRPDTPA